MISDQFITNAVIAIIVVIAFVLLNKAMRKKSDKLDRQIDKAVKDMSDEQISAAIANTEDPIALKALNDEAKRRGLG